MQVIAFVGPSGTGKSHRAMFVAALNKADAIIDDGLLISGQKILAGTSAKREKTKVASVKHALFMDDVLANEIIGAINKQNLKCIMILGTSENMANKIATRLKLPEISRFIHIEEIASEEEISMAQDMRLNQGKHVIPIPTFQIREDFSGYFLHPMKFMNKYFGKNIDSIEKTIVRPTYSYLGEYTISDNVIAEIAKHEAKKHSCVSKINSVNISKSESGVIINVAISYYYKTHIPTVSREIINEIGNYIEHYTSVNVLGVNIIVREMTKHMSK